MVGVVVVMVVVVHQAPHSPLTFQSRAVADLVNCSEPMQLVAAGSFWYCGSGNGPFCPQVASHQKKKTLSSSFAGPNYHYYYLPLGLVIVVVWTHSRLGFGTDCALLVGICDFDESPWD